MGPVGGGLCQLLRDHAVRRAVHDPLFPGTGDPVLLQAEVFGLSGQEILSGGAPKFLQSMAGRLTSLATNGALIAFGGTNAVSVYGVLMYTKDLIWPILFGMYGSIQPAISYNFGRGSWDRIRQLEKWCFGVNGCTGILVSILIAVFPAPVIRLFVGGMEPEVLTLAVFALRIFTLTLATKWFSFGIQSLFTAVKKPKQAACISLSTALIFPLFFLVVFYPLGLTGIWMIYPATSVAAGMLGGYLLWKARREMGRGK